MDTNKTHTKIDYSQFPSNTPVYGEFSNENNIYTYVYIKEALRIKSNMLNKTMRRSLIAYDIIVDEKEELKDPLTYMEETLDNQLEDMGYPVKYINEYKKDDVDKVGNYLKHHLKMQQIKNNSKYTYQILYSIIQN